jgi:hypothetical protein
MDSLSIQYNLLNAALLRIFGDRVELVYVDASSAAGREEIRALKMDGALKYPVVADGNMVLFSGQVPVAELIRYVRRNVTS